MQAVGEAGMRVWRMYGFFFVPLQAEMRRRTIRPSTVADLPQMLAMIPHSRKLMRAAGNTVQWPEGYPGEGDLRRDIEQNASYIIEEEGRPVATFALVHGIEPTYGRIDGGLWLDDTTPYATIHRLACVEGVSGVGRDCFEWCLERMSKDSTMSASLRADTHESNALMRHLLDAYGFTYCGIVYMDDGSPRRAYQRMMYPMVQPSLKAYAEASLLPRYDLFDAAHRRDHAERVMAQSMELAGHYPELNRDMVYAIAVYHDLGLCEGRERHHLVSAELMRADKTLARWFSPTEVETMAEAVEDHRASADHDPRSLYGRIVAEADRNIEPEGIVLRTVQYGMAHYRELDREGHWHRTLQHLEEKYAPGGYLKLYIPHSRNAVQMERLHTLIADRERLRHLFNTLYDRLCTDLSPQPIQRQP